MHTHHITLSTGANARSRAADVTPADLAAAGAALALALADGAAPLPGMPGHSIAAQAHGKCLAWQVLRDGAEVARYGLATHSRCGARMWRELLQDAPGAPGAPDLQPRAPWCAAVPMGGADLQHLAGVERAICWAWIAHMEGRRDAH